MKVIDLKMQQQLEEAAKRQSSSEQPMFHQDGRQMMEKELRLWEKELKKCGSKEKVWQMMEELEEEIRLTAFSVENNPTVPLEKKLEYTVMKDTKLSMVEELVLKYSKSGDYERLPEREEPDEVEEPDESGVDSEQGDPFDDQTMRYARAKANYEVLKQSHKEDGQEEFQPSASFEAKG